MIFMQLEYLIVSPQNSINGYSIDIGEDKGMRVNNASEAYLMFEIEIDLMQRLVRGVSFGL
jgi:hypothetical protein